MQGELFTNDINLSTINIYADESKNRLCDMSENIWHYICLILIPTYFENQILKKLMCARHKTNNTSCIDTKSKYYEKNNKIIHFNEIKSADEYFISKRWLEFLLDPTESFPFFYINILGINISKLQLDLFGNDDYFRSIYNRFFRSGIIYAKRRFFGNRKIIIQDIYHEIGEQQYHPYFPWHVIFKVNEDCNDIECSTNNIKFLEKNHKINIKANILQLIDLFLGTITNSLHDSTKNNYRINLTEIILPLARKMLFEPGNKNSSYKHKQRFNISFFPKKNYHPGIEIMDNFYRKRSLLFADRITGQTRFDYKF